MRVEFRQSKLEQSGNLISDKKRVKHKPLLNQEFEERNNLH